MSIEITSPKADPNCYPELEYASDRRTSQDAMFSGHRWSKLVRNARDTGATSILARQVLEKTVRMLSEGFSKVETMVETSLLVRNTSSQLSSTSDEIKMVSQETKIVSINATIEANRASGNGRAFQVVAQQMTKLSEDVHGLSSLIDAKLLSLNEAIGQNKELCNTVGDLFSEIKAELQEFHRLMTRIEELSLVQVEQLGELESAAGSLAEKTSV